MNIPPQHQSTVLEVRSELGVAVQVTGLEDAFGCTTRERTQVALCGEYLLAELTLTSADAHQRPGEALRKFEVDPRGPGQIHPRGDALHGPAGPLTDQRLAKRRPVEWS